ncbi:MAG: TAXI family TRAP transporter solute-binding subunit [Alphaproteobacteria bacterium]|nr:TAXI family TRAP transporter solute-binding subunit [Alphaproteobacteria bacterium]
MRDVLKIYLPITLLVVGGFLLTWQFVDPAPPNNITIATGMADGSLAAYGERYKAILARSGITLEVRHTAGARENIELLSDPKSGVALAFIQGGIGDPFGAPDLRSVASLFYEPVWVLARGAAAARRLTALKGRRIAIGVKGSGTRVLAKTLLTATDIDDENATLLSLGGEAAAAALADGRVDAAFFVSAVLPARLRALIKRPDIHLLDFAQADAYQRRYQYLSKINLPQGVLDLSANLPATDMTLVAPTSALVVRDDIHPALIDLFLGAAIEIHRSGNLTTPFGLFPSPKFVDFPLDSDAERFLESGPTFLRRVLPFGAAILVERLVIMLLPLLTLMIPLFKIAPPAYRWGIRRKVYRWYKELKRIEQDWQAKGAGSETATIVARLDTIQDQVGHVRIPLSYAEHLYHLRLHIGFVRQLVTGEPVPVRGPDGAEDG